MEKYIIQGFKWFAKTYGNTYHRVIITRVKDKKVIYKSDCLVYGYGEQWKHTAYKELVGLKLVKKEDEYNHELNHKRFIYIESDLNTQRELKNIIALS